MRKLTLIFLFNTFVCILLQAQNFQSNSIGPSPQVVAGTNALHSPSSLYTGIPQIGIPLHQIRVGSMSVPIGLSYRADGLKVTDISSWVGTGWHLQAGGAVTRVVRGRPDESFYGFWHSTELQDYIISNYQRYRNSMNQFFDVTNPNEALDLNNIVNCIDDNFIDGCYDTEPDLFSVQAPGLSATFLIDRTRVLRVLSQQSLDIQVNSYASNLSQWKVTTPNGRQYIFGQEFPDTDLFTINNTHQGSKAIDRLNTNSSCEASISCLDLTFNQNEYMNTWHLIKIISPSRQDTVYYDYTANETTYTRSSRTQYKVVSTNNYDDVLEELPASICTQKITMKGHLLKRIRSSMGHRVEFITEDKERLDLIGGKVLSEIESYFRGKKIKSIQFKQSYFSPIEPLPSSFTTSGDYSETLSSHLSPFNDARLYRLRLDGLEEYNHQEETIAPYVFEYEGHQTPVRYMYGYDRWGYYNGSTDSSSIATEVYQQDGSSRVYLPNRAADATLMKTGILKKIIFPSGASRSFEYEPQTYFDSGGILQDNIEKTITLLIESKQIKTFEIPHDLNIPSSNVSVIIEGSSVGSALPSTCNDLSLFTPDNAEFTINTHYTVNSNIDSNFDILNPDNSSNTDNNAYSITDNQGNSLNLDPVFTLTPVNTGLSLVPYFNTGQSLVLDRGKVYTIYNACDATVSITIKWTETQNGNTSPAEDKIGGGLRIKNVTIQDDIHPDKSRVFHYVYTEEDEEGNIRSSGRLKNYYSYYHEIDVYAYPNLNNPNYNIHVGVLGIVSADNFNPLAKSMGGHVGYNEVSIIEGDITGVYKGKSTHKFSNIETSTNGAGLSYPFAPVGLSHSLYGLATESTVYKWQDTENKFYPIQRTIQEYDSTNTTPIKIWGVRVAKSGIGAKDNCTQPVFYYNRYAHIARRIQLLKTKTFVYDDAGQVLQDSVLYKYEPIHGFPRETTRINSKGERIQRIFNYVFEADANLYTSPMKEAIVLMQDRYMLSTPLEVESRLLRGGDWELLGRTKTLFEVQDQVNNALSTIDDIYPQYSEKVLPRIQYAMESENPVSSAEAGTIDLTPLVKYQSYDGLGHLLSSQGVDKYTGENIDKLGIYSSQIWSDMQSYLSAEVVNASTEQIAYTSFEHLPTGNDESPYSYHILGIADDAVHTVSQAQEGNWEFEDYQVKQNKLDFTLGSSESHFLSIDYPQYVFFKRHTAVSTCGYDPCTPQGLLYTRVYKTGETKPILELSSQFQGTFDDNKAIFLDKGDYNITYQYEGSDTPYSNATLSVYFQNRQGDEHYKTYEDAKTGLLSGHATLKKTDLPAGTYRLSLWAKGNGSIEVKLNNASSLSSLSTESITPSTWTYQEWQIPVSEGDDLSIEPGANIKLDEVRLMPKQARMVTYNYEPLRKQIHTVTDANNHCLYYEYDDWGRLLLTRDEDGNIIEHYKYQSKYEKE